jgi:hypothetical protein
MSITNFKKIDSENGVPVAPSYVNINTVADITYSLSPSDVGDLIRFTSSSEVTVALPLEDSIPVGSTISIVQWGTGPVQILPGTGVTIHQEPGISVIATSPSPITTRAQYSRIELVKVAETLTTSSWLSDGYGIYVQEQPPSKAQVGDLWFW